MSLPTSGYTPAFVNYDVAIGGLGLLFQVSLDVQLRGESVTEEIIAALEPALISLASDMESVSVASAGQVYKYTNGVIPSVDIAA